jgi:hypothetical protein
MAVGIGITFSASVRKKLPADWMHVRIRCLEEFKSTIKELGGLRPDCNNAFASGMPYMVTLECLHSHHARYSKIEPLLRRKIEKLFGVEDFTMKECGTRS